MAQAAHPRVSSAKYRREVENVAREAAHYRALGVFLLVTDEPIAIVGFAAPQLKPSPLVFAMQVDYSDYDLQAPSVRFVDPFTSVPYQASGLPTMMMRTVEQAMPAPFLVPGMPQFPNGVPLADQVAPIAESPADAALPGMPSQVMMVGQQPLLQAYGPDDVPFLCVAGVREYHEHPGHSGDPWELHRTTGAGSLTRLIQIVRTYAIEPIGGWNVNLVPQVSLGYGEAPR